MFLPKLKTKTLRLQVKNLYRVNQIVSYVTVKTTFSLPVIDFQEMIKLKCVIFIPRRNKICGKEVKVYFKVKMADVGRKFGTQVKQNISSFQNYLRSNLGKKKFFLITQ